MACLAALKYKREAAVPDLFLQQFLIINLMKRLIISYVFILIVKTLTLQTHFPLIPSGDKSSKTSLAAKSNLQNNPKYLHFMDDLNKITNEAGYVLRFIEFSLGKKSPPELIPKLKKYNTGLEAIRKVLIKYNLFIYQQEKTCPNPSSFNKSEIYRYINYTEQHQAAVVSQIEKTPELHDLVEQTKKMKQLSDNYLTHLKSTLQGQFCNLPKTQLDNNGPVKTKEEKKYYKNNLDVSNWYYGSTNQIKYKAYLLKKAANYNLTTCPSDLPFVRDDQQKCFNCPHGSIYNLGAEKCDSCRPGKMLNVAKGTCQPCFGQMFIINHQFVCKACAIQAEQLFDPKTGKCYKCKSTEYLDAGNRTCMPIKCPPDQPKFNRELELCQTCPVDQIVNSEDPSKCMPKCTKEKPLYNNMTGVCTECPKDQVYNYEAKVCKKKNNNDATENNENQATNQNGQAAQKAKIASPQQQNKNPPVIPAFVPAVPVAPATPVPAKVAATTASSTPAEIAPKVNPPPIKK